MGRIMRILDGVHHSQNMPPRCLITHYDNHTPSQGGQVLVTCREIPLTKQIVSQWVLGSQNMVLSDLANTQNQSSMVIPTVYGQAYCWYLFYF